MPESQTVSETRCADFLVIGAMKSGTTTLYHDLRAQPSIFLPDKESNFLLRENWRGGFEKAKAEQFCGEVCPDYAKLPDLTGVVEKAAAFRPKVVFLARNPIDRMISHHHFISSLRAPQNPGMSRNIDEAVTKFPELVNYGRYVFQLRSWVENLGRDSILLIRFEDFVDDREDSLETICKFIGADFEPDNMDSAAVHNRSEARPVLNSFWKRIRENQLYRSAVRPFTSLEMRNRMRRIILPSAAIRPEPPSEATLETAKEIFRADLEELKDLLNQKEPLWDLDS